jgi:hypothetical protein
MHEVLSRAEAFVAAGNQVPPAPSALDSDRASSPSRERKDFDSHHVLLAGYEQPTAPKR